jgi:glutamate 5-kinase
VSDAPVIVVKVGTRTLTDARGDLDLNFLRALAAQLCELVHQGRRVVLVTSGAIRAGLFALGLAAARGLPQQQAAAAVGQIRLMRTYGDFCRDHGVTIAQVLLSRGDTADRRRYLNARNTLRALLDHGVLPIINENDTVTTEEIQFGDNDQLAAQVCQLVAADLLIVLTDVEGFLLAGPDGQPRLVPEVHDITPEIVAAAGGSRSGFGRGGMASKINAARIAMRVGCRVVLARGKPPKGEPPVLKAARGEAVGTVFHPAERSLKGRKRWLAASAPVEGTLTVDEGAAAALLHDGRSLLAVGVRAVEGDFGTGDLVRVVGPDGAEIGRGLSNFGAAELRRIAGARGDELAAILGYEADPEVVHRDNLATTADGGGDEP